MVPRYRFGDFVVSPQRRMLVRQGREQPLIPRYFDLLVYLIEHRHEAVHRRDIFDRVWSDVIVSESALSQAVRTIRRALGDDSREPRFIRTISRHGYQFIVEVVEEQDDAPLAGAATTPTAPVSNDADASDPFEPRLTALVRVPVNAEEEEAQREAAELLHALGTSEALRRLGTRDRHPFARALLRDTRWDSPQAGDVPLLGGPAPVATARALIGLRLRRAARIVAARWASASIGGGLAGLIGGAAGGVILAAIPGSPAPAALVVVLAVGGWCCGALGGAGVGAGLSLAEAVARSQRAIALVIGGALGGGVVGASVQWLGRLTLESLVGVHVATGGGLEGLVIGGAAGLGYLLATPRADGGLAAPRGRDRQRAVAVMTVACGLAALALALAGRSLAGGTVHAIAQASQGSQAALTPLGHIFGETDFGPITRAVIAMGEGAFFGAGLAIGLTRRPSHTSHATLTKR